MPNSPFPPIRNPYEVEVGPPLTPPLLVHLPFFTRLIHPAPYAPWRSVRTRIPLLAAEGAPLRWCWALTGLTKASGAELGEVVWTEARSMASYGALNRDEVGIFPNR